MVRRLLGVVVFALACGPSVRDASTGEVLVVVDTDMPVPAFVSRLRVDLYDSSGNWYATRDVSLARPESWPTSFGVSVADDGQEHVVLVRLRAYPEGVLRDYRGERYAPRPPPVSDLSALAEAAVPPPTDQPRLTDDAGRDVTPVSEPQPFVTIDRLVRVRVPTQGHVGVFVPLRGACVGTMADVAGARTCVANENESVAVEEAAPADAPQASAQGTFAPAADCTAETRAPTGLHDAEICVPGAMFQLGSPDGDFGQALDVPERVAIVDAFRVDEYEVSVARWRAALAAGLASPDATPTVNDGAIPTTRTDYLDPRMCTWSSAPMGREDYPLTCVSWDAARAFCRFQGGDLPTEAEWEWVAINAGRDHRSRFTWGGDDDAVPSCSRAVWGRGELMFAGELCTSAGLGPSTVQTNTGANGDSTPTYRVAGLGGSVAEWMRDAFAPYTATCWASAPLHEPSCLVDGPKYHALRGGTWRDNLAGLVAANRRRWDTVTSGIGFRCVRPGAP